MRDPSTRVGDTDAREEAGIRRAYARVLILEVFILLGLWLFERTFS